MDLKPQEDKPRRNWLPAREDFYRDSLLRVTRIGGITAGIFISFFTILYWALDYPWVIVLVNLTAPRR